MLTDALGRNKREYPPPLRHHDSTLGTLCGKKEKGKGTKHELLTLAGLLLE